MTKEQKLKREAKKAARFRGHKMGVWQQIGLYCSTSRCKECNMAVTVDLLPPLNGIDIGGKAVALDCTGKAQLKFNF